jgi:hypothetical protein
MLKGLRIVFEEDGYPRELIGQSERVRAVSDGALSPSTPVTIYRAGSEPKFALAGEVEELQPLFSPREELIEDVSPEEEKGELASSQKGVEPFPLTPRAPAGPSEPPIVNATRAPAPHVYPRAEELPLEQSPKVVAGLLVGGVILILVLFLTLRPTTPAPLTGSPSVPQEQGVEVSNSQAVVEGVIYEWEGDTPARSYRLGDLVLTLSAVPDAVSGLPIPTLEVSSPASGRGAMIGVPGFETARARFALLRPNATDSEPSVLLMTFSGGAHCCTSIRLLMPSAGGWRAADLGEWDGEPFASSPTDFDRDGALDFVLPDNAFLYAFASYAESRTPSRIFNVRNGNFADVSGSPGFAGIHRENLEELRRHCVGANNAACAAYVASAARLGEDASAFEVASRSYNRKSDWELPTRCAVAPGNGGCPPGAEQRPSGFIEALRWFLEDRGYLERGLSGDLDSIFSFTNPERCEHGPALTRLFAQLSSSASLAMHGKAPVPIDHRQLRPGEHGSDWATHISIAPITGSWIGLSVTGIAVVFVPDTDGMSVQVRFAEQPTRVRAVLNRYDFQLPPVGRSREISDEGLPFHIGLNATQNGAALACST